MRKVLLLIIIVTALSIFMPVERFVADALRPPPDKVLSPQGIVKINETPLWLYAWRAVVALTVLLFAAIVATFFTPMNRRARLTIATISLATAVFHYLTLLTTSTPFGYGISIYPLFYTINIDGTTQLYIDIGQILIIYSIYNYKRVI